jgi:NAD dependent epimerase/dehydratase family enzyme
LHVSDQSPDMVTVAIAGGTGGVGRTIVEELVGQDKHEILILSRKVQIQEFANPEEELLTKSRLTRYQDLSPYE